MPLIVKCSKCDEVLYTSHEIVEPREVLEAVGGKCPKCRRPLSLTPEKVEVHPYELEEPEAEPNKEPGGWFSKILREII